MKKDIISAGLLGILVVGLGLVPLGASQAQELSLAQAQMAASSLQPALSSLVNVLETEQATEQQENRVIAEMATRLAALSNQLVQAGGLSSTQVSEISNGVSSVTTQISAIQNRRMMFYRQLNGISQTLGSISAEL